MRVPLCSPVPRRHQYRVVAQPISSFPRHASNTHWCLLPSEERHGGISLHPYWEILLGLQEKNRVGLKMAALCGKGLASPSTRLANPATEPTAQSSPGFSGRAVGTEPCPPRRELKIEAVPLQPNLHSSFCRAPSLHCRHIPPRPLVRFSDAGAELWPSPFSSPFRLQIR